MGEKYIFALGDIGKCGSGGNGKSDLLARAEAAEARAEKADMERDKSGNIDMESWKPCGMCGYGKTLYQHTHNTKLFINHFGETAMLVTECMSCPPYANCCMKGISANSEFKINFCPACGRPLTPEAWDELEKRLRG